MIVYEVNYTDYEDLIVYFSTLEEVVILDSSDQSSSLGQYSFIGCFPFSKLTYVSNELHVNNVKIDEQDLLGVIDQKISEFYLDIDKNISPFQGGVMGYFSYDLSRMMQGLKVGNEQKEPHCYLAWYDLVIAFCHQRKKAWVFSSGLPEKDPEDKEKRANERLQEILQHINKAKFFNVEQSLDCGEVVHHVSETEYIKMVQKAKDYIKEGDIFEVNLSQMFSVDTLVNNQSYSIFNALRKSNPAPFSCYIACEGFKLISSSPERFLKKFDKKIWAHPIKGTIKRGSSAIEDKLFAEKLLNSEKDRAENTMIVDLMRNDLSAICQPYSVKVLKLCSLETYQNVHHLVSVVEGSLKEGVNFKQVMEACFPGGSITGAPKLRSMEIIDELEKHSRGAYCGSAGYIGFDGSMDLNILIRTMMVHQNSIRFHAGGAVTLGSDPKSEYQESLLKVKAIIDALKREKSDCYY